MIRHSAKYDALDHSSLILPELPTDKKALLVSHDKLNKMDVLSFLQH